MKTIIRHFLPLAAILLSASCIKEQAAPVTGEKANMTFYGYAEESKTVLESDYSVSWQVNDAISVFSDSENGRFEAVEILDEGKTAKFEGIGFEANTYYAVYPYSESTTMDGTEIHTQLPALQQAAAGSFDPAAALMTARTSGTAFYFMNAGAIVGFSLKNTGIESVTLSSADGMTPVAGAAAISLKEGTPVMTIDETGEHAISMNGPFEEGEKYYFTVAPGTYRGLALKFTDAQGRYCVKSITKDIEIGRCGNKWLGEISIPDTAWKEPEDISAELKAFTSSTLTFSWGEGANTAANIAHPYVFGLYKDEQLSDPVAVYSSEKSAAIWGSHKPAFTFAGLEPDTQYWFAVSDPVTLCESVAVEAKTRAFDIVYPADAVCTNGAAILAENFSELIYGGDGVNVAAGIADGNGTLCDQSKESLLWDGGAMNGKRLEKWSVLCQEPKKPTDHNNAVLARPGYVKLGGYSYAVNIVSPALECIPEGKAAKVKVTFTASRYGSDSQNTIVSLVTGTENDNRFTIESRSDIQFDINSKAGWNEYSVELDGATKDSRILIGPDFGKSGKGNGNDQHRMYLGDVKVEVLQISKPGGINAEFAGATSSTLKFKWTKDGSEDSKNESYTFGLYNDPELTGIVSEHTVTDKAVWNGHDPGFIFAGLESGKTYYFHVTDKNNPACESDVITATTEEFEVVVPGDVQTAAPGTVILAEDFSELLYGGDNIDKDNIAAGLKNAGAFTTTNLDGERIYTAASAVTANGNTRLNDWALLSHNNANAYEHPGYLKFGGANHTADLVTPVLSCIPEGKEATVRVTFSASRYDNSESTYSIISLVTGTSSNDHKFTVKTRTDKQFDLNETVGWNEYSFELDGATKDSRVLIGPDFDKSEKGAGNGQHRMYIDNIRIEVVGLYGISADLVKATSSTLSFKWTKIGSTASYNEAYTFGLYCDPELANPVNVKNKNLVYSSDAGAAAWSTSDPAFIFSGLESGKTYYFRAVSGNDCESRVIAATTEEFTHISPEQAEAVPGAIILAEDFSEFTHGGDGVNPKAAGIKPDGTLVASGNDTKIDMSGSLSKWSLLCQRTTDNDNYTRPGYVKLGGGSYVSDLVTPELSCIPEGKTAKIRVTFSAAPYSTSELDSIISLIKVNSDGHQFTKNDMSVVEVEQVEQVKQFKLPNKVEWTAESYEFDGATKDSRVLIGPDAEKSGKGNGKNQHRMFLDNIIIEVISID